MMNMRCSRWSLGSAAALALIAGTAYAQYQPTQRTDMQQGGQMTQYRDSGQWQPVDFLPELSDAIVILKSETDQHEAKVHILHGQVQAKLDDQKISTQQVLKRGDKLRILDNEGETVAELTLPDLQMVRQAHLQRQDQFGQQGLQQRQFGIQEQQWRDDRWTQPGTQRGTQFQDDWRQRDQQQFRTQQRFDTQDDWRFRDQQQFRDQQRWDTQDDWRMRDQQQFRTQPRMQEDRRFRDDTRTRDWRLDRDRHIGDTRMDFQRQDDWRYRDDTMRDDWRYRDQTRMQTRPDPRFDDTWGQPMMRRPVEQQLGIQVSPASPHELRMTRHQQGLRIEHVQRNSPLDMHGIQPGDIIVSVDGRPATHGQLQRTLTQIDERDTLRMTVVRDGRERTLNLRGQEVTGMQRFERFERVDRVEPRFERTERFETDRRVLGVPDPAFRQTPALGVVIQDARRADLMRSATGARYDSGVLVTRVHEGSPADRAGLRSGDVIVEIDGRPNITSEHFRQELSFLRPGDPLNLTVIRDNRVREINVRTTTERDGRFRERDDFDRFQPQYEEPSRQERLFRLPGQVPPGPDRGIYQPSIEERWDDRWDARTDTRWDTRWDTRTDPRGDTRWETWERRDTLDTYDRWDTPRRDW
jgi:hypothetical protein